MAVYRDMGIRYDKWTGAKFHVFVGDVSVIDDFAKLNNIPPGRFYRAESIIDEDSRVVELPINEAAAYYVDLERQQVDQE